MMLRPAGWRDCWYLYTLRKHLSPEISFWAHLRWFTWRVKQPCLWICYIDALYGETRVGTLRLDTIAGLRWASCHRDPSSPPGPGRWMMAWLESRPDHHPLYGIIENDNTAALRYTPQPPWRHFDMGTWTLVALGDDLLNATSEKG